MDYDVVAEESFGNDYESTTNYLDESLGNPQASKRLVVAIRDAVCLLKTMPSLHAISRKPVLAAREMREHPVGSYVIVYQVDEDAHVVRLHRLFHQSQQFDDEWYWRRN